MTFDGIPIVGMTSPALLGIVILLILTGKLIPRRTYDDMKEDRDSWRAAHAVSEEARIHTAQQLDEMMEVGQTVKDVLQALRRAEEAKPE